MTTITRFALITVSVLGVAGPAAAQSGSLRQDLDRLKQNEERLKANRERLKADKARLKEQLERIGPEYTETFSNSVKIGQKGSLDLSNIAGDVTVTAAGGDDVKIEAVKRVRGVPEADARALLKDLTVTVNDRSGLLEVRTEFPRRRSFPYAAVDYKVSVPPGTSLTLRTVSGDLDISGVKADVTSNSVSGDITVRDSHPRAIDIETVSGSVHFASVDSDRVQLRSVSGDIEYTGRLVRNGRYDMQSHSGDIRIVAPESSGFDIEATTFSGDVKSDYPLTIRSSPRGNGFQGLPMNRSMRGSFGDASAVLTLRSFSGNIAVTKK